MDIYEEITSFYENANTEKRIIGKSLFNRKLYAIKLGQGAPVGLVQYAIHGREYITAKLAIEHKTGARGLRTILEGLMLKSMFELPSEKDIEKITVTAEFVRGEGELIKHKRA